MDRLGNRLDGEPWQIFERRYREGYPVTGTVSRRIGREVCISLTVEAKRKLAVQGFILDAATPHGGSASMYVPGQKVQVKIACIKRNQPGNTGWIELDPTRQEWRSFVEKYRSGAIVGGKVKIVDTARHRVCVLLHDIELVGVIDRDGMLPCCQKDISHLQDRELKLRVNQIVSESPQQEIRLQMQRVSYLEFGAEFSLGAELDGTIHARDEHTLWILLDEGIIGTVPGVIGTAALQIGTKVRVRIEAIRDAENEIHLSLLDPTPRFGRVYWAEDGGIFSEKSHRSVIVAETGRITPRRPGEGIKALFLSTTGGQLPCAIEKVCFLNRSTRIAVKRPEPDGYPLQRLQPYQQLYRGELPQEYQQEIQRRLGLR